MYIPIILICKAVVLVWTNDPVEFKRSPKSVMEPSFPWSENSVKFEQISIEKITKEQEEILRRNNIEPNMWPYVNITAVAELETKRSAINDTVIRDEDVSDDSEGDDHPMPNTMHNDGKKTTITITEEAGLELYQHWTDQAVSGLMAAVATNKLKNVGEAEKLAHKQCNKEAMNVKQHARCVVELLDMEEKYQHWLRTFEEHSKKSGRTSSLKKNLGKTGRSRLQRLNAIGSLVRVPGKRRLLKEHRRNPFLRMEKSLKKHYPTSNSYVGGFKMRAKRSMNAPKMRIRPVSRDGYTLLSGEIAESPLGKIASNLLRDVRRLKNKKELDFKNWRQIIAEIREEGTRIRNKQKAQDAMYKRLSVFRNEMKEHGFRRDYMKRINIFGDDDESDDVKMENLMLKTRNERNEATDEEKIMKAPIELIREVVKMGMMISGKNISGFEKKNVKLISPRFLPVTPEQNDDETIKLISPSLFPLHDQGHGIESKAGLLKGTIFQKGDNEAWLNLIIEAAGVSDALDSMKKDMFMTSRSRQRDDPFHGPDGQPLWFSKQNVTDIFGVKEKVKVELFERLQETFSEEQLASMNSTGYIVMNSNQLDIVYGVQSPFHDPQIQRRFSNVSANEVPVAINSMIRGLAAETIQFKAQRRKSIVLAPLVLGSIIMDPVTASQPVILSPVLLTPLVLSPAIFGAVILSPWVFVPVILSPRLLSPVVLSPVMFSPIVLSPLAFDPLILSPGVGAPFILSPLVLSPFILSPVALNPLILSPFALTPFIGIPHTLSPLVLSPFILSPIIYSPPFVSAFVLSPHALSPIIESNGKHFTSILSPSWLS